MFWSISFRGSEIKNHDSAKESAVTVGELSVDEIRGLHLLDHGDPMTGFTTATPNLTRAGVPY